MATESALAFSQNKEQMMTPILPADQSMAAGVETKIDLRSSFGAVASNDSGANIAAMSMTAKPGMSNEDKLKLADDANGVGMVLQDKQQKIPPQGLAAEAGSAALKLGGETLSALGSLFGSKQDQKDDFDVQEPKPTPSFQMGLPSPGMGMGGH